MRHHHICATHTLFVFLATSSAIHATDVIRRLPRSARAARLSASNDTDSSTFFLFVTTCSNGADVESELLAYSFWRTATKGNLRRLDACNSPWRYPTPWLPSYRIHTYKPAEAGAAATTVVSTPWMIARWLRSESHASRVAILDPAMVMLSPLDALLFGPSSPYDAQSATRGKPIGGYYMYGNELQSSACKPQHDTHDCQASNEVADAYYRVGPPLALHAEDLNALLPVWAAEVTRRATATDQKAWTVGPWTAYMVAAGSIGLRHGASRRFFVSNPSVDCDREDWQDLPTSARLCGGPLLQSSQRAKSAKLMAEHIHPMLFYCQSYSTAFDFPASYGADAQKVPGRYFSKDLLHSGDNLADWQSLFRCGPPSLESQEMSRSADRQHLVSVLQSPKVGTQEIIRRRHAFMVAMLSAQHGAAFRNYRRRVCRKESGGSSSKGKSGSGSSGRHRAFAMHGNSPGWMYGGGGGARRGGGAPLRPIRVAFMITSLENLVRDGFADPKRSNDNEAMQYIDGAAVLARSVAMTQPSATMAVDMVALTLSNRTAMSLRLQRLGYRVLQATIPIHKAQILGKYYRETLDQAGCCGSAELLKLRAYQLIEYDSVMALDADALVLHSLEPLIRHALLEGRSLLYTEDLNMAMTAPVKPVNGGWLLITPSTKTYNALFEVLRQGDFRANQGWGGTGIGWWWGGRTIQGVLAYYYKHRAPTSASEAVDFCTYNMMHPKNCTNYTFDTVQTAHFTLCQKPWKCIRKTEEHCQSMTAAWWAARMSLESANGLPRTRSCARVNGQMTYRSLPATTVAWFGMEAKPRAPPPAAKLAPVRAAVYNRVLRKMRYWERADSSTASVPPERAASRAREPSSYLLFDYDCGGFNNVRMGLENALVLAKHLGRTLVLPPPYEVYLLGGSVPDVMNVSAFSGGLPVIELAEFIAREGTALDIPARFQTGTGWMSDKRLRDAWAKWKQQLEGDLPWGPIANYVATPSIAAVSEALQRGEPHVTQPFRYAIAGRKAVEYTDGLRAKRVLNLPACKNSSNNWRWLGQVALYILDADSAGQPSVSLLRLLRDHVHYVDRVWELAARAVASLGAFEYNAMHIRRGEFQYKQTRTSSENSLESVRVLLKGKRLLYMATDESSHAFFTPWRAEFSVVQWKDLIAPGGPLHGYSVPRKHVGLVEQAICTMGARFIGTQYSTFSSYIGRLRTFVNAPDTRKFFHTLHYATASPMEIAKKQPPHGGANYMSEHPFWDSLASLQ